MTTDNSTVNSQIVDAVSSIVTLTTGQSPSQALAMLDAVLLETLGMAMHNAVNRQQSASMVSAAALTAACAKMLAVPFPAPPAPPPPAPTPPPAVHPLPGPEEPPPQAALVKAAVQEGEIAFSGAKAALENLKAGADAAAQDATDAEHALADFAKAIAADVSKSVSNESPDHHSTDTPTVASTNHDPAPEPDGTPPGH